MEQKILSFGGWTLSVKKMGYIKKNKKNGNAV